MAANAADPLVDYAAAVAYLNGFVNYERIPPGHAQREPFDLSRVRELAQRLGDPQRSLPALHVAGTKGKGSTCAFAAAMLRQAGLRVGLYTSPHLLDPRERIQIDGAWISEPCFLDLLERMRPHLEEMRLRPEGARRPTYFEILTHLAFLHFQRSGVDAAVVEVGLGGRLDATNILSPRVCAITRISLDHMEILGATIPLIAREKAGILKAGTPAVVADQEPEALRVIEEVASAVGAPLEVLGREFQVQARPATEQAPMTLAPFQARLAVPGEREAEAVLGLAGSFQVQNWAVAVRSAQLLHRRLSRPPLDPLAIRRGSAAVRWPGRLEEFAQPPGQPRVFLDGAHNRHSLQLVTRELRAILGPGQALVVIFGCASDKDIAGMLEVLAENAEAVVFTGTGNPRACNAPELAARWQARTGRAAQVHPEVAGSLALARSALEASGPGGLILVTGSLYLVGRFQGGPRFTEKGS